MTGEHKVGTILTFVLGATVGAVVALLFAPKPGEELRDDIAEGVGGELNQIRRTVKNLNRRAHKIAAQARDQLQDAIAAGEEAHTRAQKS